MGYIWAIYYPYLLTTSVSGRVLGYTSHYPAGTRVINYPDTAALMVTTTNQDTVSSTFCTIIDQWRLLKVNQHCCAVDKVVSVPCGNPSIARNIQSGPNQTTPLYI